MDVVVLLDALLKEGTPSRDLHIGVGIRLGLRAEVAGMGSGTGPRM